MTELRKTLHSRWLICLLLAAVTFLTYWPVLRHDFINFDDPDYVTSNSQVQAGLTWNGVVWALSTGHAANWHPLTWLSLMLDSQLYGMKPAGFHLTNLLFHIANSLLLFLVLRRMTGALWRSAVVAALFALHPLHVESVAWIAERKDVLSGFFFMLTLLFYARYAGKEECRMKSEEMGGNRRGSPLVTRHSPLNYGLALFFFALGLMSKPMLVTLPFVLLLLDYWPLGRVSGDKGQVAGDKWRVTGSSSPERSEVPIRRETLNPRLLSEAKSRLIGRRSTVLRLVLEKAPFFALAFASSAVTLWVQQGALQSLERLSLGPRLETALIAYATYIEKTVWPSKLAILYLSPSAWPAWQVAITASVLAAILGSVLWGWRRLPYLSFGWLWFVGTLVPVIGIIQVGNQSMADRYTYIPLVGVFIIVAWGSTDLFQRLRLGTAPLAMLCLAMLMGCATLTRVQLGCWQDSEALFQRAIQVTQDNFIAHNNLGHALATSGKLDEAKAHYLEALRINPRYTEALNNMGILLTQQGKMAEARPYLEEAIRIKPQFAEVYGKLGFALAAEGRFAEAISYYHEALRLKPELTEVLNNLAWLLATNPDPKLRDGAEAVRWAERACELTHYQTPIMVGTLAAAYAEAGRFEDAVRTGEKARKLALAAGHKELVEMNRKLIELYRAHKPYREASQQIGIVVKPQ